MQKIIACSSEFTLRSEKKADIEYPIFGHEVGVKQIGKGVIIHTVKVLYKKIQFFMYFVGEDHFRSSVPDEFLGLLKNVKGIGLESFHRELREKRILECSSEAEEQGASPLFYCWKSRASGAFALESGVWGWLLSKAGLDKGLGVGRDDLEYALREKFGYIPEERDVTNVLRDEFMACAMRNYIESALNDLNNKGVSSVTGRAHIPGMMSCLFSLRARL